jgi:hypothetical protein
MRGLLDAFQVITLASLALIVGGRVFVAAVVLPVINEVAPEEAVRMHQQLLTRRSGGVFKRSNYVALAAAAACIIVIPFVPHISKVPTIVLTAIVLVMVGAYGWLTTRESPINREVLSWGPGVVKTDYPELRVKWDDASQIKLGCSVIAFFCALAAVYASF